MARFKDRSEAGRRLAELFSIQDEIPPVVLALLPGGAPVAVPIARRLNAPLDILSIKKIKAPSNPEIVLGAVTDRGAALWNEKLAAALHVDEKTRVKWERSKQAEAKRQIEAFRGKIHEVPLAGRRVVIVDDGLATGTTLELALRELKRLGVSDITVAIPVAASSAVQRLQKEAGRIVTLSNPKNFRAVREFYEEFSQIPDEEALSLLEKAQPRRAFETEIERLARPLDRDSQLGVLAEHAASARIVVLDHAVSGTRELEQIRRKLSQILIQNHGFGFVAIDTEPGAAHELNKLIRSGRPVPVQDLISKFGAWPRWLYANEETQALFEPMHKRKADFYGLDVYSFFESMTEARRLKREGRAPKEIVARLGSLLDSRMIRMGLGIPELFDLKHNLQLIEKADSYFERLLENGPQLHDLHDRHLLETLLILLKSKGPATKAIVWTNALSRPSGLGRLLHDHFGPEQVCVIGATAGHGLRLVSEDWGDSEGEASWTPPLPDDWEARLHAVARKKTWDHLGLIFDSRSRLGDLAEPLSLRLGSVVENESLPEIARAPLPLSLSYDAFIYVDRCTPLQARPPRQLAFDQVLNKHLNRRLKPEARPSRAK